MLHDLLTSKEHERDDIFDDYFGSRQTEDESTRTRIRITPTVGYSENDGLEFKGRFSARLDLPHFKHRVQIVANNLQQDEDVLTGVNDVFSRQQRIEGEDDNVAGLRVVLIDKLRYKMDTGLGLRFKPEPVPKVKLRGRAIYLHDDWRFELMQLGFWESDDGFGEKTEAIVQYPLTSRLIVRNINAAVWEEEEPGMILGETLRLEYTFPHERTIGLTTAVRWHTRPNRAIDSYSVRVPYRQRLWKDWIYIKVEPGAEFPDDHDFEMNPLITLAFDFYFGEGKTVAP